MQEEQPHQHKKSQHLKHKPSDETDKLIELINTNNIGWKADPCKLQKHHHMYAQECQNNKVNLAQTNSETEEGESYTFGHGEYFSKAVEQAQQFQKKYQDYKEIPDKELPKHFDWRNVNGYDFTGGVRDQKACGSCYTVAFTQAVEARMKIKYGEDPPQMSPQFLLACNYMTEGCEGGWPHFHAYFT